MNEDKDNEDYKIAMESVAQRDRLIAEETKTVNIGSGVLTAHVCRFKSNADIFKSIEVAAIEVSKSHQSNAVVVLSCVGSVSFLKLRMANASSTYEDTNNDEASMFRTWNSPLEIVSLVGTIAVVSTEDSNRKILPHLHMSVSDEKGNVYGGHFVNGIVHTTMELALGTISNVAFNRVYDPCTGYRELIVSPWST
jgi:uncharacterized protein